jgi:hypothetical protein
VLLSNSTFVEETSSIYLQTGSYLGFVYCFTAHFKCVVLYKSAFLSGKNWAAIECVWTKYHIIGIMTWNVCKQYLQYKELVSFDCVNCNGWHVEWPWSVHLKVMRNCFEPVSAAIINPWCFDTDAAAAAVGSSQYGPVCQMSAAVDRGGGFAGYMWGSSVKKKAVLNTIYLKLWVEFTNSVIPFCGKTYLKSNRHLFESTDMWSAFLWFSINHGFWLSFISYIK